MSEDPRESAGSDQASVGRTGAPRDLASYKRYVPEWVKEIAKQSPAIVVGILLALWVDDWKARRVGHELAVTSLQTFLTELKRNEARIDDELPYHKGMRAMLDGEAAH